ncbi:extracellular solute-binding protein [Kitasatospora sp. NPDC057692]|uniref:extracellular solute-binding protein n=1 Tax=Kitasatospora sp. NPDC057692 TaxID=3346215 RepID=UPI00367E2567
MKRQLIAAVGVAAMVVGLAACGSDAKKDENTNNASGNSSAAAGKKDYNGKTLKVWLMSGSAPKGWDDAVKTEFESTYPGSKVEYQVQEWTGIGPKVTAALSEGSVDVLEIGNTQTAGYAATGGLLDITKDKAALGGADWAANQSESAILDGKQYAAPWFVTNRAVTYNKDLWAAAGLSIPKTLDEFYAALEKLKTTAGVTDPIYMPGQEWYVYFGLLTSEGGKLAKKDGDKWVGGLSTPEAQKAFDVYKKLQSYSVTGLKDKDEAKPQQKDVFGGGGIGTIIGLGWEVPDEKSPVTKDKIGHFALPGKTADKPSGVFLGGSNIAIASASKNTEMAKDFLKIALNDKNEGAIAAAGNIPNKASLNDKVAGDFAIAAKAASSVGGITPTTPNWSAVENDPNPIKEFLTAALTGDYNAAAKKADEEIAKRLNAKQ